MKSILSLVAILLHCGMGIRAIAVPQLSSYPSARAVIFLDFDGHTVSNSIWNNGDAVECLGAPLSNEQIIEIFNRVAEDYRPFNLNITTDSAVFLNAPLTQRMRVIITPTNYWKPGPGGIAYIGSFRMGEEIPCFVFTTIVGEHDTKALAEVVSHESGHTLGLNHQSTYDSFCNLVSVYNEGAGTGETAWAPIMGTGNSRNLSLWNYGPTQNGCYQKQDNLYFLTRMNGFDYRADDHGNDITNATDVTVIAYGFNQAGIITTISDVDFFRFNFPESGRIKLHAQPFSVGPDNAGANLDISISLLNAAGDTISVFNPDSTLDTEVDTALQAGVYYVSVDGTGNINTQNDYGSLGSYSLSGGFFPNTSMLPIRRIILKGYFDKNRPIFKWDVDADEPLKSIELEGSDDRKNFKTIYTSKREIADYGLPSTEKVNQHYRIKVTTTKGKIRYSELIRLDNESQNRNTFKIRNVNQYELIITTDKDYSYQVFDSNGRLLNRGKAAGGTSHINVSALPRGLYMVRLFNGIETVTEKILKQ